MLKRVLIKVDFPSPDSPALCQFMYIDGGWSDEQICGEHTNNHDIEVEALADALAVPLIGKIGEANVACQLSANNVSHVAGGLGSGLWVFRRHGLRDSSCAVCHYIAQLDVRRCLLAIRHCWACRSWRRPGWRGAVGSCEEFN